MKKTQSLECAVRKVLMTLPLLVFLIIIFPLCAYGAEYTDESGTVWEYTVPSANTTYPYPGTALISRCSSIPDDGVLVIPETIEGVQTTGISNAAFKNNSAIEEVILPPGFRYIGSASFSNCPNLKRIRLVSSLQTIEAQAFEKCGFDSIEFPASMNCTIKSGAFTNSSLRSVVITGDVQFEPSAGDVFAYCRQLSEYAVSGDNQNYTASGGVLFSKDMTRLEAYPIGRADTSYTVPDDVTVICNNAFYGSRILQSISLPGNLQEIRDYAFCSVTNLETVDIPPGVKTLKTCAFSGCSNLQSVTLHEGLESIGNYAFQACTRLLEVELPEGLAAIGDLAFNARVNGRRIYVPESVGELGEDAFLGIETTLYTTNQTVIDYAQAYAIDSVTATREEYRAAITGQSAEPGNGSDPSGDGPADPEPAVPEKVLTGQAISCSVKFTMSVGKSFHLKAKAKTPLSYQSSDIKVATVDRDGKVTIKGCGTCTITVTASQTDTYKSAKKNVVVNGYLDKPVLKGKNKKGKKVKLNWNRINGAAGYKLYVRYPGAKKYVRVLTLPAKVKGVTHRKLSKGRTYRYKLRAYCKVGKKTVYSKYSKVIKVKIKK